MPHLNRITVRFDDVDFARVVYFPKLFGYCHQVFEAFFATEVNIPYPEMLMKRRVGFPTVHAGGDFKAPLRFGDICRVELTTLKASQRSIHNRYQLFRGETDLLCASLEIVTAAIAMDTFTPTDVPEEVREAFLRFKV